MTENYMLSEGNSPVIIHAPHGGVRITDLALESLIISREMLQAELLAMTDWHTDFLATKLANPAPEEGHSFNQAGTMINCLSRLVIDPERFPDEREEMNAVGMGAVYTQGSQRQPIRVPNADVTQLLIDTYFHPYALALEEAVGRKLEQHGRVAIIDLHSYASKAMPYELHRESSRPEICLGFDINHCSKEQLEGVARILEDAGYQIGFNTPFSGTYVPLKYYGIDHRVSSIMLEIRRDIYLNEATGELNKEKSSKLLASLRQIVDFLTER